MCLGRINTQLLVNGNCDICGFVASCAKVSKGGNAKRIGAATRAVAALVRVSACVRACLPACVFLCVRVREIVRAQRAWVTVTSCNSDDALFDCK